jgi:putative acetyltransferase
MSLCGLEYNQRSGQLCKPHSNTVTQQDPEHISRPVIRRSHPEDLGQLYRVWVEAVRATHHFLSPQDFDSISAIVRDKYLPSAKLWVTVDDQDVPVGFLGADGDKVDSLFVHPAHHGQGLGRALIESAFTPDLTIYVDVNEANMQAIGFYKKMGFVECGRSGTDGAGMPYPLIHMIRRPAA